MSNKFLEKLAAAKFTQRTMRNIESGLTVGLGGTGAAILKDRYDDSRKKKHSKKMKKEAQINGSHKDALDTATIGLVGGVGTWAGNHLINKLKISPVGKKAFGIGTGIALAGDYAAVKLNKHLDKKLNSAPKPADNKYLNKVAMILETNHKE